MATATKVRSRPVWRKPSGGRVAVERGDSEKTPPSSVVSLDTSEAKWKAREVVGLVPDEIRQYELRVLTVETDDRVLPRVQQPTDRYPVVKPPSPDSGPKQDEVSVLQGTYRAFWTGKLAEERIEEECRCIRDLFHA